jgi:L-threonylcarbamoyladenylate synthase
MSDAGGHHAMDFETLEAAAQRLREGRVVAFPTETVYGLGADALNPAAVREVFRLKGRPAHNPLIVHVSGPEMAEPLVARWTDRAERVARGCWAGPVTIVLPKSDRVPAEVTAGGPTVALRSPDHPLAAALLMTVGRPLVGPSANRSGHVSPTRAEHVREAFSAEDVMVLDGGACGTGIESTVLWLGDGPARVLRPGVVGAEALAEVLGEPVEQVLAGQASGGPPTSSTFAAALPSPGMLSSHYAPRTPAIMVDLDELDELLAEHASAVVLSNSLTLEPPASPGHRLIRLPASAQEYAAALYAAMRSADREGARVMLITTPPRAGETREETAIWRAVHDRLARATARRE